MSKTIEEAIGFAEDALPYYTYLRFNGGSQPAFILSRDDFRLWVDYENRVFACELSDAYENSTLDMDWKLYLNGEDVPFPETTHDGAPHPSAGQMQHWDGMDAWYKVIHTNDVETATNWLGMNKITGFIVVALDIEATSLDALRKAMADQYIEDVHYERFSYPPEMRSAEAQLDAYKKAGLIRDDL